MLLQRSSLSELKDYSAISTPPPPPLPFLGSPRPPLSPLSISLPLNTTFPKSHFALAVLSFPKSHSALALWSIVFMIVVASLACLIWFLSRQDRREASNEEKRDIREVGMIGTTGGNEGSDDEEEGGREIRVINMVEPNKGEAGVQIEGRSRPSVICPSCCRYNMVFTIYCNHCKNGFLNYQEGKDFMGLRLNCYVPVVRLNCYVPVVRFSMLILVGLISAITYEII